MAGEVDGLKTLRDSGHGVHSFRRETSTSRSARAGPSLDAGKIVASTTIIGK
jgi:hypothetical protein